MSRKPSLLNAIIVHRIEKTIIFKENLAYVKYFLYLCARNCKMGNCVNAGDQIVAQLAAKLSHSKTQRIER